MKVDEGGATCCAVRFRSKWMWVREERGLLRL